MTAARRALEEGAGAFVVSEEALSADASGLHAFLAAQPVWSDLPIIVLSRSGSESPKLTDVLERTGNVFVVERPVRVSTFLSLIRAALRSRERQYEVRDHLREVRALEAERTALWESEREARAQAEHAGRMKDEFLATLSHEIRTPLNAIQGWTHVLLRGDRNSEDLERGLSVIERNARAQAQIVADLLDMNRIVNGKIRLDLKCVDLAPIVQGAVDTITPTATAKGVALELGLEPAAGEIRGDQGRLQQIFWNLLSNAVKFTSSGGRVKITLARVDSDLELEVTDTGEGISADFLPHVFDRFRQADGTTTRRQGGLGLGLAIVKQLVELHGGRVRAESGGRGLGSTFTVSLPLAAASADEAPAQPPDVREARAAASTFHAPAALAGVKVLVVDDEVDARELLKRILEDAQARVALAASAEEAFRLVGEVRPDIVVSDIGMPGEDGYALMRRVRALAAHEGGDTRAIALTAYARPEDRERALRAGFQFHSSKPVEPSEFLALVASALRPALPRRPGRSSEPASSAEE